MQPSFNLEKTKGLHYLIGDETTLSAMPSVKPNLRFDEDVLVFLDKLSKNILADKRSREYPDVVTLAFWIRRASLNEIRKNVYEDSNCFYIGRGTAFHIAPSNVPVNYMYSLVTGLLAGNANIVKVPSKDFEQVEIINEAIMRTLTDCPKMKPYITLVKYGHERDINDALSEIADARIIWGGDGTISEIRKSELPSRAIEVAFADRYSLAVIDADEYLACENKEKVANDFFNDTYLTDQNACTSPRAVAWTGDNIEKAKNEFWQNLHNLLDNKYSLQSVQAVNKLTSAYLLAAKYEGVSKEDGDNMIVRMNVNNLTNDLMELKDSCGYFFEYSFSNIEELRDICDDTHCQTITYFGNSEDFKPIVNLGLRGVDRVVPMGASMNFEFIWDGYNLIELLTRVIRLK